MGGITQHMNINLVSEAAPGVLMVDFLQLPATTTESGYFAPSSGH